MKRKKRIIVSVTNNLETDQRVKKVCDSLLKLGFEVILVGRKFNSNISSLDRGYKVRRLNLLFNKGFLFYANYNLRLFFFLLMNRHDFLWSNDLDTLLANFIVSKLKGGKLIYDSHEYFTEVPEIQNNRIIKMIWESIESFIFPRLRSVLTVNKSISDIYISKYKVEVSVVRNIPTKSSETLIISRSDLGMPIDKKILVLQGAGINVDRGAEELLEALALIDGAVLYVIGSGDVINDLKSRSNSADLKDKVFFLGKLPYHEMMSYTSNSDVGVSLDKPSNLNYKLSLPNKIFDYIKAGVPIFSSDLVEIRRIVDADNLGVLVESHDVDVLKHSLQEILFNESKLKEYKENVSKVKNKYSWENEFSNIEHFFND